MYKKKTFSIKLEGNFYFAKDIKSFNKKSTINYLYYYNYVVSSICWIYKKKKILK